MISTNDKNKSDGDSGGGGKFEKMAVGRVVYAEAEKMLAFGPVSCVQAQGTSHLLGIYYILYNELFLRAVNIF